jgi:CDGSH-type Zn-finger protein
MARLVKRTRSVPYDLVAGDEKKAICGCGLSSNLPFCDGTHTITKGEAPGKLFWYNAAKERQGLGGGFPGIMSDEKAVAIED